MKKAAKGAALQAVTANALKSGAVVFRTPGGRWSPRLAEAQIAADKAEALALLAAAERDADENLVVEPYLIDVAREGGRVFATRLREAIRTAGPTIQENRSAGLRVAA